MAIKNFYKIFTMACFTLIFLYCHLLSINYNQLNTEENIYKVSIILFLSTFLFGFKLIKFDKNTIRILIVYILFWISCLVSMNEHHELRNEIALVYLILPLLVLLNNKIYMNFKPLLISSAISILPLLVNIQHSNTFGLLVTLGFVCLFIAFTNVSNLYFMMMVLPFSLFFIYETGSRTALLSFVIFITFYLIYFLRKRRVTYLSFLINVVFLIALVAFSVPVITRFIDLVFHKRSNTNDNFLADRQIFWEGTIQYGVRLWGNGKNFFMQNFSIGDSHNLFIEILGIYGLLPLMIFLVFVLTLIIGIFSGFRFSKYKAAYFFMFFFLTSFTENLFFIYNRLIVYHFIFILFVTYVINRQSKNEEEVK
ncbi:O-antigen ligase family protein [Macrococcus brunensis]|uniref:O-antigen ligase family protein n=1 Tax=Macrococcus brunensis TaxID=198483 RepID=UPI002681F2AC